MFIYNQSIIGLSNQGLNFIVNKKEQPLAFFSSIRYLKMRIIFDRRMVDILFQNYNKKVFLTLRNFKKEALNNVLKNITKKTSKYFFLLCFLFRSKVFLTLGLFSQIKSTGKRSELRKSEHQNSKRTSKKVQRIRTSKVSFQFITTTTSEHQKVSFQSITTSKLTS